MSRVPAAIVVDAVAADAAAQPVTARAAGAPSAVAAADVAGLTARVEAAAERIRATWRRATPRGWQASRTAVPRGTASAGASRRGTPTRWKPRLSPVG